MDLRCKKPLSPRPTQPLRVPNHNDWARLYPDIKYLYIHKRHKLRYIMQHVERTYGLKASEQMYKKRLCQWHLLKKTSRPPKASQSNIIPPSPRFSKQHRLNLMILESVRTWSKSFFEASSSRRHNLLPDNGRPAIVSDFVLALKLVSNLLARGHGHLAGRVTRKAFLMLEDISVLDGPAVTWNLLEIMHHMMMEGQEKLCQMLLVHLPTLIGRKTSTSHPLFTMLHGIKELLMTPEPVDLGINSPPSPSPSPSTFSSPSSSSGASMECDIPSATHPHSLLDTLKQSWLMNARMIFDSLDIRLFSLYCSIDWDLCSLNLSAVEIERAHHWFDRIDKQGEHSVVAEYASGKERFNASNSKGSATSEYPSTSCTSDDLPDGFEKLRATSIATMRRDWNAIIHQPTNANENSTIIIRILAVLVTANILPRATNIDPFGTASVGTPEMLRMHAGHIASAMRTLLDLRGNGCTEDDSDDIELVKSIQSIITLCSYAYGETDLRVVRELWSLQDAFIAAGDLWSARQTEKDAIRRLNRYVRDVRMDS